MYSYYFAMGRDDMIYFEDECIKLGDTILPGLVKSIEVTESARVDEQEVEGSAVKPKQATGYEDAKVVIELIIDDTQTQGKYERYASLRRLFRQSGQSVPQPIAIICEDTAAHGIDKVIFKQLSHRGENKKGQLTATLELWEYIPQTITARTSSSSTRTSGSSQNTSSSGTSSLTAQYEEYLEKDRGRSPAQDSPKAANTALDKLVNMKY